MVGAGTEITLVKIGTNRKPGKPNEAGGEDGVGHPTGKEIRTAQRYPMEGQIRIPRRTPSIPLPTGTAESGENDRGEGDPALPPRGEILRDFLAEIYTVWT